MFAFTHTHTHTHTARRYVYIVYFAIYTRVRACVLTKASGPKQTKKKNKEKPLEGLLARI